MVRVRLRDLGITIGRLAPGPLNAITDVPGVQVGHSTVIEDSPHVARTGVTLIAPRENTIWTDHAFAASDALNGFGVVTGLHWLEESGLLCGPVALTGTYAVGTVYQAMVAYETARRFPFDFKLPVVGETHDGWLSEGAGFPVTPGHVEEAFANLSSGPVAEGNVGGGTGMNCHEFKGGIGTSSRLVDKGGETFTVGVLVQANYGVRERLRLDGVPVGHEIGTDKVPAPWEAPRAASSILVIMGTDAPLLPVQCKRLARRATVGLARVGGIGENRSGDIFLAFATGNHIPAEGTAGGEAPIKDLRMLPHGFMTSFFVAVAEAVEEAIWNALCAAETMTGQQGRVSHALPLDTLEEIVQNYRPK